MIRTLLIQSSLVLALFVALPAHAVTIAVEPALQTVLVGSTVDVDLTVSGLGDFAPDSLGAFDVNVLFDPAVLGLSGVSFGDPVLGDQLDLFGFGSITGVDDTVPGIVGVFEISLDLASDLDTLQAGSFTLATLSFDALAIGSSSVTPVVDALADSMGSRLTAQASSGFVGVVPEPGSWTLFLVGAVIVGYGCRAKGSV